MKIGKSSLVNCVLSRKLEEVAVRMGSGEPSKNLYCKQCPYKGIQLRKLKAHVKSAQDKLNNFDCRRCCSAFSQKKSLIKHEKRCSSPPSMKKDSETNVGLNILKCNFCSLTFTSDEDFKGHIRKIHIQGDPEGGNHIKQIILQAGWHTIIEDAASASKSLSDEDNDDEDQPPMSFKKDKGTGRRSTYICNSCDGCFKQDDCGECLFCKDKTKFGGPNKLRKKCAERVCGNKSPRGSKIKKANKAINESKAKKRAVLDPHFNVDEASGEEESAGSWALDDESLLETSLHTTKKVAVKTYARQGSKRVGSVEGRNRSISPMEIAFDSLLTTKSHLHPTRHAPPRQSKNSSPPRDQERQQQSDHRQQRWPEEECSKSKTVNLFDVTLSPPLPCLKTPRSGPTSSSTRRRQKKLKLLTTLSRKTPLPPAPIFHLDESDDEVILAPRKKANLEVAAAVVVNEGEDGEFMPKRRRKSRHSAPTASAPTHPRPLRAKSTCQPPETSTPLRTSHENDRDRQPRTAKGSFANTIESTIFDSFWTSNSSKRSTPSSSGSSGTSPDTRLPKCKISDTGYGKSLPSSPAATSGIETATRILSKRGMPYHCKSDTEADGNCFFHAVADQLTDGEISSTISPRSKEVSLDHMAIRRAAVKFARETDVLCNEWLIEWLKAEQEKPLNEVKTRVQIWEDYLSRMSKDGQWADEVIIRVTAMFFGKDIRVIPESTPYFIYGSMDGQKSVDPPMAMVHMSGKHFQSVHRRRTSDINVEIEGEAHINEKAAPHPLNDLAQENSEINLLKYQAELFHRHGRVDEEEDVKTMVRILSE